MSIAPPNRLALAIGEAGRLTNKSLKLQADGTPPSATARHLLEPGEIAAQLREVLADYDQR